MEIYQLAQGSLSEIHDFDSGDIYDLMMGGNPVFSSVEKAKAFAAEVCRDEDPEWCAELEESGEPIPVWGPEPNGVLTATFGDDETGTVFSIIPCNLDPKLED